jgi:hypothetical protein
MFLDGRNGKSLKKVQTGCKKGADARGGSPFQIVF